MHPVFGSIPPDEAEVNFLGKFFEIPGKKGKEKKKKRKKSVGWRRERKWCGLSVV